MPQSRRRCISLITVVVGALTSSKHASSMLLSDLPTPSFIIDIQALRRVGPPVSNTIGASVIEPKFPSLPTIRLPKNGLLLHPTTIKFPKSELNTDDSIVEVDFPVVEGQPAIGYIHSSVVRAREDAILGKDDPISTFLAEIDLDPSLCGAEYNGQSPPDQMAAKLVLGLNNHHVGSYYWARSAGAGSSMEAPGVWFGNNFNPCSEGTDIGDNSPSSSNNKPGILRWLDEGGPTASNSNDGKRSEWVNFLRKGDTVQLVPMDGQSSLIEFINRYKENHEGSENSQSMRIFGISSEGRPMGSEPAVVCEWISIR